MRVPVQVPDLVLHPYKGPERDPNLENYPGSEHKNTRTRTVLSWMVSSSSLSWLMTMTMMVSMTKVIAGDGDDDV